jgi:hypothetical protein
MTRAGLEEFMEAVRSRYVRATHMEKIRILHEFVASTGPPIMIKFTLPVIEKLGFARNDTILSLEMRMKCGIGKCVAATSAAKMCARTALCPPWRSSERSRQSTKDSYAETVFRLL